MTDELRGEPWEPRGLLLPSEELVYVKGQPMLPRDVTEARMSIDAQLAWYAWDHGADMPAAERAALIKKLKSIEIDP